MILPAGIAKGMEFDCVGICDASADNFPEDEFLCRVLYVMMTRPLHRLCIWHRDTLTPLLPRVNPLLSAPFCSHTSAHPLS